MTVSISSHIIAPVPCPLEKLGPPCRKRTYVNLHLGHEGLIRSGRRFETLPRYEPTTTLHRNGKALFVRPTESV